MSAVDAEIDTEARSRHNIPPVTVSRQRRLCGSLPGPSVAVLSSEAARFDARLNFPNRVLPGDSHCVQRGSQWLLTLIGAVLARREDLSLIRPGLPSVLTGEGARSIYNPIVRGA